MTEFKALNQVFDARLHLPGPDGRMYTVPEPDRELGLWCQALFAAGLAANFGQEMPAGAPPIQLDDDAEDAMYRRVLGQALWDELGEAYGYTTQRFFALTAFLWIGGGQEVAAEFWNAGGDPKASMPREARRRAARAPRSASMQSTGAASTTPPAVSTSTTTRRRTR